MKNGKKKIAKVLQYIGTILLVIIILMCIPFTIPRFMGYEIYEIVTESMEPEYPVGSVIYVKEIDPEQIKVGDVITFSLGTGAKEALTHRVEEIRTKEQQFITKGDANKIADIEPVSFSSVIGKPQFCLKHMAKIADLFRSTSGKWMLGGGIVLVLMLWLISDRLKKENSE